jgi:hypothetical protein
MTLKEKFKQWLDTQPREQIREVQLEVIAEEFAIGFAQWCVKSEDKGYFYKYKNKKELLQIYKEEKGL